MLDLSLGNWRIWYEKVWAAVYLVPSDTNVLEIYLLKTQKCYMMSSCMTKLEFPLGPYMLFRLGKLPHICCLLLHWVLSSFVDPYERFVMLLKSRSCTHHIHIYLLLLHWEYAKQAFHLIHQKIFYSYTGSEPKIMLVRFSIHQINATGSYWYLSQSFVVEKRHGYMQKLFIKKRRKKEEMRKNGQPFEIFKTMGTQMPT